MARRRHSALFRVRENDDPEKTTAHRLTGHHERTTTAESIQRITRLQRHPGSRSHATMTGQAARLQYRPDITLEINPRRRTMLFKQLTNALIPRLMWTMPAGRQGARHTKHQHDPPQPGGL